jgi:integrase
VTSIHAGDDPKAVSTNAGHYSVAFTLDRYGHFMDSMRKESSERMEQFRMSL